MENFSTICELTVDKSLFTTYGGSYTYSNCMNINIKVDLLNMYAL